MSEQYGNNPLHGLKLETLIEELVGFYGFEILGEALNFKCFQLNPSIKGSLKFLKKTQWAREKIEAFYLYKFKNLPRPDAKQYELAPRDRIVPEHQKPRAPKTFTLEELKAANAAKAKHSANKNSRAGTHKPNHQRTSAQSQPSNRPSSSRSERNTSSANDASGAFDPWAQARQNFKSKQTD